MTKSEIQNMMSKTKPGQRLVMDCGDDNDIKGHVVDLTLGNIQKIPFSQWTEGWPSVGPVIPSYTTVYYVGGSSMSIVVPGTLTSSLISNIGSVQSIYGGTDCTTIGNYAFYRCQNLRTMSFPACVEIGSHAFYNCQCLTTASFQNCVSIRWNALQYCSNLVSVNIPDTITTIETGAFGDNARSKISFYTTSQNAADLLVDDVLKHGGLGYTTYGDVYLNGSFLKTISYKGNCCFASGTKILTSLSGSTKNIEDMEAGDDVVSYDLESNTNYVAKVKNKLTRNNITDIAILTLDDGKTVTMHAYHPILTQDGWHSITNHEGMPTLIVGDMVKTDTGYSKLIDINRYTDSNEWTMYNLDVVDDLEDPDVDYNDNFYANGICTHNAPCPE